MPEIIPELKKKKTVSFITFETVLYIQFWRNKVAASSLVVKTCSSTNG